MLARKPKIHVDPERLYVPLQAHVWGGGVLTPDDVLRGSHHAVTTNPALFAELGLTSDERIGLLQTRFPISDAPHDAAGIGTDNVPAPPSVPV